VSVKKYLLANILLLDIIYSFFINSWTFGNFVTNLGVF